MKEKKIPQKQVKTPETVKANAPQLAKSVTKYLRISPRKVRLVINAIRRRPAHEALAILFTLKNKAARFVEKGVKSAVANAKVLGLDENRLIVAEVRADGGPTFKRFMARSMGRADRIIKRTTHLSIFVGEGNKTFNPPIPLGAKEEKAPMGAGKEKKSKAKTAGAAV